MNAPQETVIVYPTEEQENKVYKETNVVKEKFYPTGAIAFFLALVILCLAVWFGIYFLMLERI